MKASGTITVVSGLSLWVPSCFPSTWLLGAMGSYPTACRSSRDRGRGFLLYKSHETAATFLWSTIDPRILPWPANGACFNHLLLVNTFFDAGRTFALEVQAWRTRWLTYLVTKWAGP